MKKQINKSEATSEVPQAKMVAQGTKTTETRPATYVVVRDGYRVSDRDYQEKDDPFAIQERGFWKQVEDNHSWGAKVDIVPNTIPGNIERGEKRLREAEANASAFLCTSFILRHHIYWCMVKRRCKSHMLENELYILPSPNDEMREFVKKFKIDMMEHVISSIKFAIENKLDIVEVFQFKNSPYVVTISEKEFITNLDHIGKFYKENQIFELCSRVEQLQKLIQGNTNEKEKPKTDDNSSNFNS